METQAKNSGQKKRWKKPCMTSNHLKKTMQHQEIEYIMSVCTEPSPQILTIGVPISHSPSLELTRTPRPTCPASVLTSLLSGCKYSESETNISTLNLNSSHYFKQVAEMQIASEEKIFHGGEKRLEIISALRLITMHQNTRMNWFKAYLPNSR